MITMSIAYEYCSKRGFGGLYRQEWIMRFARGMEWQLSDYAGRALLQSLSPADYPKDIKADFIRRVL